MCVHRLQHRSPVLEQDRIIMFPDLLLTSLPGQNTLGPETRKELWHRKRETRWKIRDQDCKEGQSRGRAFSAVFVKALRVMGLLESRMKPTGHAELWEHSWS